MKTEREKALKDYFISDASHMTKHLFFSSDDEKSIIHFKLRYVCCVLAVTSPVPMLAVGLVPMLAVGLVPILAVGLVPNLRTIVLGK